jgi:XTP/dITP diphosphohydrolase
MELIFATNNLYKIQEVKNLVNSKIRIISLNDSGYEGDIPEDYDTLEKNSSQKAWYIYNRLTRSCFADDTGLEVESLNNEPGVYSARYSRIGTEQYNGMDIVEGNISKLLDNMQDSDNRSARFRTVISLILDGKEYQFEGVVNGSILKEKRGSKGFGYDPVFLPEGFSKSFAQMCLEDKNKISHRFLAISKLVRFLNRL